MTQQSITLALAASTISDSASLRLPTILPLKEKIVMRLQCLASIVALVVVLQARVDAALINGLKAYYDFNESSGSSLPLVYGAGNDGVLNNMNDADWVAGQTGFGNALDFDGSNDFVHIAGGFTNTVSGDNTHTVSLWFYPRSVSNAPLLIDAEDLGPLDYFIEFNSGIKGWAGVGGAYRTYSGSAPTLNAWHHIVLTKTGAGDNGALYLDGAMLTTFTGTLSSTPSLTSDYLLGAYRSSVSYNLNGLIDDVAFWDRNLSDAEVASLFNAGAELAIIFVPEPSTLALLGLGAIGLAIRTRRRRTAA